MFAWLKRILLFGKKAFSSERWEEYDKAKKEALEKILGSMDNVVGHAFIPFQAGGPVDMYYFSQHLPGTVFATMELLKPDGEGPKPNRLGTFELVACSKIKNTSRTDEPFEERKKRIEEDNLTPFERINHRLCGIMSTLGHYSFQVALGTGHTAELPGDDTEDVKYVVFDEFDTGGVPFEIEGRKHGLLLVMEIFPSELRYAKNNGSYALFEKLKAAGVYPYSDMDRQPVV